MIGGIRRLSALIIRKRAPMAQWHQRSLVPQVGHIILVGNMKIVAGIVKITHWSVLDMI